MTLPCLNEPNTLEECVGKKWMVDVTPLVLFGITGITKLVVVAHDHHDDLEADQVAVWVKLNEDDTIAQATIR